MPCVRSFLRACVGALGLVVEDDDRGGGVGDHGPFVTGEAVFVVEESSERDAVVVLWRILCNDMFG